MPHPNLAFSHRLTAYDHARPYRQPRQIIRIRHNDFGYLDNIWYDFSGAGQAWSPAEFSIAGASKSSLAMVVGEFVPNLETLIPYAAATPPNKHADFDPTQHPIVGPQLVLRTVVVKVSDLSGTLYLLSNKDQDSGLCNLTLMPMANNRDNIVWYNEWASIQSGIANADNRWKVWKEHVLLTCASLDIGVPPGRQRPIELEAILAPGLEPVRARRIALLCHQRFYGMIDWETIDNPSHLPPMFKIEGHYLEWLCQTAGNIDAGRGQWNATGLPMENQDFTRAFIVYWTYLFHLFGHRQPKRKDQQPGVNILKGYFHRAAEWALDLSGLQLG